MTPPKPPRLERASREHALRFAREMFLRSERIDMRELAGELGVGRTTLYRWVGDRETVIGEVLAALTERTWQIVGAEAAGEGVERGLGVIRAFMEVTSQFPPLRQFAETEPAVALRVLMTDGQAVNRALRTGFSRALDEAGAGVGPDTIEIMVQLATALEWTPIVIGEPPAIDRAVTLMRHLVTPAPTSTGRAED